jgi:hypothetical protein
MLEFFTVVALAEHMKNKKDKENKQLSEYFDDEQKNIQVVYSEKPLNLNALNLVGGILALIIGLFTARLAYGCNLKSDPVVRVLSMLFGFFFSGLYLLYYFFRYIILGNKC